MRVRHIANMARLRMGEEEVARLGSQWSGIVEYVEKLNEAATEDVEATAHPLPICNVRREDVVRDSLGVEAVLGNAPDAAAPYFKVPKVLDQMDA